MKLQKDWCMMIVYGLKNLAPNLLATLTVPEHGQRHTTCGDITHQVIVIIIIKNGLIRFFFLRFIKTKGEEDKGIDILKISKAECLLI
jgi:hypothetical protein